LNHPHQRDSVSPLMLTSPQSFRLGTPRQKRLVISIRVLTESRWCFGRSKPNRKNDWAFCI